MYLQQKQILVVYSKYHIQIFDSYLAGRYLLLHLVAFPLLLTAFLAGGSFGPEIANHKTIVQVQRVRFYLLVVEPRPVIGSEDLV